MSRPSERLVDVELVEAEAEADEPAGPRPLRSWRSRVAAVPRRVWLAAAAVAAVGAVTTGVVEVAERAAETARLARTDGLSASLDQPLVEAWRTDGTQAVAVADGAVLVQAFSRLGDETLTALDAVTGEVRWTQRGWCRLVAAATAGGSVFVGGSRVPEVHPDDVVMCTHGSDGAPGAGRAAGRITTHDPATGGLRHTIALDDMSTHTTSTLGTDLVAVGIEEDGHVRAGRWSLRTGDRLWDYRSVDASAIGTPLTTGIGFSVDADAVVVQVGAWEVRLDPVTGAPLDDTGVDAHSSPWGPVPLPDGGTAVGTFEPDGSSRVTVRDADGATRFSAEGLLLPPAPVDDGSGPPIILTMDSQNGGMVALDAGSGEERWRTTVPVGDRVVLSGMVVVTDGVRTTALDAWTGEARWAAEPALESSWALITDGRRLLTVEAGDSGAALVARDLGSGEPVWTADSPVGSAQLRQLPDGTVLAGSTTGIVALRPPVP